jgi:hypothetical protein
LIAENCQRGRDYGGVRKGLMDKGVVGRGIKGLREEKIRTIRFFWGGRGVRHRGVLRA